MSTFLVKTEPGVYSFTRLVAEGSCVWDGVTNPAACKAMRAMKPGDEVLVYHTGDDRAIVGLAKVSGRVRADPSKPDLTAAGEIKFPVAPLEPVRAARTPMTLETIKADGRFAGFALVTQARLSVMEVPPALDAIIRKAAGLQGGRGA
ncbi:MAG: EVE domain-containing protein [Phycisphaerae bacterium]|jgi:predicted RNA-binding protein with PUA-like domain